MKTLLFSMILSLVLLPLAACETSHTESTHHDWTGGTTHKETTVTETPLGTSVDEKKTVTH